MAARDNAVKELGKNKILSWVVEGFKKLKACHRRALNYFKLKPFLEIDIKFFQN